MDKSLDDYAAENGIQVNGHFDSRGLWVPQAQQQQQVQQTLQPHQWQQAPQSLRKGQDEAKAEDMQEEDASKVNFL